MVIHSLRKRVVIIDEDEKFREGLSFAVDQHRKFQLIKSYTSFEQCRKQIHRDGPDLIILDIATADQAGIEDLQGLKLRLPFPAVVVYTHIADNEAINAALAVGVSGYILKDTSITQVIESLLIVSEGGAVLSPLVTKKVVSFFQVNPFTPLSYRETEVLKLITQGKTYSEIAGELSIAVETSKTHIKNIYRKLNVSSKSEAVRKALSDRLISLEID